MTPEQLEKELKKIWKVICCTTGGMTNPLTTTGDIIYSSSGTTADRLGIGTDDEFLAIVGGVPSWEPINIVITPAGTGEAVLFDLGTNILYHRAIGDSTFIGASTASDTISLSLSATGTPSANTFLRGDNTWSSLSASNGLSTSSGSVVLGQNVGEIGAPATLLSAREIPLGGFRVSMISSTGGDFFINKTRTLTGSVQADSGFLVQTTNQVENGATVTGRQVAFMHTVHNLQGTANFGVTSKESGSLYLSRLFGRSSTPTAASVSNSGTTPLTATPTLFIKNGVSGSGGTVTMNGWYSLINCEFQLNPSSGASVIENFADIIMGISTSNAFATVTTRYGLYVNPIKQSFVSGTGYSIFQEGTTDVNHFAGVLRFTNLPTYADEAAAVVGGLVTGTIYKTATGEVRIKL